MPPIRRGGRRGTGRLPPPKIRRVYQYPVSTVTVPVGPRVTLLNQSAIVEASSLASAAGALSRQVNEHLALPPPFGWGLGLSALRVATLEEPPAADEWVILLTDRVDEEGAYGYHAETPSGMPVIKVFPALNREDGVPWTVTASHELLETLCDPHLDAYEIGADGRLRALEVCDPVETDSYPIDGVAVSNFVLPAYFGTIGQSTTFDHMGTLAGPYEMRPGGYQEFLAWDVAAGAFDWLEEVRGSKRGYRAAIGGKGRGARRHLLGVAPREARV